MNSRQGFGFSGLVWLCLVGPAGAQAPPRALTE